MRIMGERTISTVAYDESTMDKVYVGMRGWYPVIVVGYSNLLYLTKVGGAFGWLNDIAPGGNSSTPDFLRELALRSNDGVVYEFDDFYEFAKWYIENCRS